MLGAGGAPSTAVRVRGYDPQKNFESSDAKSCILMTTMLISGLSSKCISQQTTSMSKAKSVTKFQLFCRVAPFVVRTKKQSNGNYETCKLRATRHLFHNKQRL